MNTLRKLTDRGVKVRAVGGKVRLSGLSSLPPDERDHLITIASQRKRELLLEISIFEWGDHAHLVEWFLSAKDTLPTERFTFAKGEGWSVIWATPAASYEVLANAITQGPEGPNAEGVRSNLEQLYEKFKGRVVE